MKKNIININLLSPKQLVPNLDYYINEDGLIVFTAHHHSQRGYCCDSGCKHCPYKTDKKE